MKLVLVYLQMECYVNQVYCCCIILGEHISIYIYSIKKLLCITLSCTWERGLVNCFSNEYCCETEINWNFCPCFEICEYCFHCFI